MNSEKNTYLTQHISFTRFFKIKHQKYMDHNVVNVFD